MTIEKTNVNGLVKDLSTNFVINNNEAEYHNYLLQKQRIKESMTMQEEINSLKTQMQEIRSALQTIMNGRNNV
jgi:hypothetical protein